MADCGVTATSYDVYTGEAMAMGERTPVALLDHAASARMAVGEALTNIAAARIKQTSDIKLSANWMAPAGHPGEDAGLYDAVRAVGMELCPALGLAIPVGKDSMSMKTVWKEGGEERSVTAPLSLIITAFAPVLDVRKTRTPELRTDKGDTDLILIDLGKGRNRLGGSCLTQVYKELGHHTPDLDDPRQFKAFFDTIQELSERKLILAYHDRSDGGLFATLAEMAFAGRTGVVIDLDGLGDDDAAVLFSEELGAVIQVRHSDTDEVLQWFRDAGLGKHSHVIGELNDRDRIVVRRDRIELFNEPRLDLQRAWSETTYRMQALRDNPDCAKEEFERLLDVDDPGMFVDLRLRAGGGCGQTLHRQRGASPRGGPPRAGCQRPDRDGGRLRPCRFRGGGRPHERHHRRTDRARWLQGGGGLRWLLLRRRARCRGGVGEIDFVQSAGAGAVRGLLRPRRQFRSGRL